MSTHDEKTAANGIDPRPEGPNQHEALCALVLGELEGAEREALERELANSPELRAERARIAATIGLVRAACAGTEALPDGVLARLEGLTGTKRKPWYASSTFRMAAGFGLVALSLVLWNEGAQRRAPAPEELARGDQASPPADEAEELKKAYREQWLGTFAELDVDVKQVLSQTALESSLEQARDELESLQLDSTSVIEFEESNLAEVELGLPTEPSGLAAGWPIPNPELERSMGVLRAETRGIDPLAGLGSTPGQAAEGIRVVDLDGFGGGTGTPTPDPAGSTGLYYLGRASDAAGAAGAAASPAVIEDGPDLPGLRGALGGGGGGSPLNDSGVPSSPTAGSGPAAPAPASSASKSGGERKKEELKLGAMLGEVGQQVRGADLQAIDRSLERDSETGDLGGFVLHDDARRDAARDPEAEIRARVERVLHDCRPRPNEKPSMMYFRFWGDNGFELAQLDPQSTFGVDVDTASYALARRYLRDGYLPEKAQVRTEEFVNYFAPDVPAPTEGTFAIHTDLAPSRFGAEGAGGIRVSGAGDRWMLRVVVRGKEVSREERQPLALTFVIDTSGSMKQENRLELVKHALRLLMTELDARDSIALVAFSNEARQILPMTSAAQRGVIEAAIHGLNADGGTNAEAGLLMGYAVAAQSLSSAAQSRVVLLSDGVANIGQTDQDRINAEVARQRAAGIYLNTIGVGMGNHNDVFLEQLANKGDGLCNYVDDEREARRALVENFTGAFTPIARDVKVQVEFASEQVYRYRLLGYENRAIADQDFRNDAIDAGEVGAGHQVVALYELELLKPVDEATLATVRLRWKQPTGAGRDPLEDSATEVEQSVHFNARTAWEGASAGYKRSVLVAQFAELLRRSTHARDDSLDELIAEAAALAPQLNDADFTEFLALVERSRELVLSARPAYEPITQCVDRLRRNQCLRAEYEALRLDSGHALLDDLERQNRELEARIRDLIREQVHDEIR